MGFLKVHKCEKFRQNEDMCISVISLERHDVCDYKMEVGTYWEEGKLFSGEECQLRGRLTFAEEGNTKLKQILDIRNRYKVKLKKKKSTKNKLKFQMTAAAAASYQILN